MAAGKSPVAEFFRKPWVFPVLIALILLVVGYLVWNAMQPAKGSWRFGVCRALVEFEYVYPITFDVLAVAEDQTSSRIYFAEHNPFGNERIVQADCDYQIDGARGVVTLTRLSLDRKPVTKKRLDYYNRLIPTLLSLKLDVDLPPALPRTLDKLKR